jgi:subtilisin-like proprotein convertase family protein
MERKNMMATCMQPGTGHQQRPHSRTWVGEFWGDPRSRRIASLLLTAWAWGASAASADVVCNSTTATIPDGGSIARTVTVAPSLGGATIVAVRVHLTVTHPWVGDLHVTLRHPNGTEVELLHRPGIPSTGFPGPWGCGGDNLDVTFDDLAGAEAEATCEVAGVAIAGTKRPVAPLGGLVGLPAAGDWLVEIADEATIDAGSVTSVCLELEIAPAIECPADLNGDGSVDGADLAAILGSWGATCESCPEDLASDGHIDGGDLAVLLGSWGRCEP